MRWFLMLLSVGAGAVGAATPGMAQQGGRPGAQRAQIIQAIERRFWARVVEDLGLNDEQATRLRTTIRDYSLHRRDLERREGELKQALARQLRPGIAADQDSVAKLTDALLELRIAYAQSFRDEHREVGTFLNPVQQAQLLVVRERLMQRIRQIQQQRQDQAQ